MEVQVFWFGISYHKCLWDLWLHRADSFLQQSIFSDNLSNTSALCLFHGADINALFDGMCLTAPRNVDDLFDTLLGNRAEADAAAFEGVVELEVLLGVLLVHNVDRVVVRM